MTKRTTLTLRITDVQLAKLEDRARELGVTLTEFVTERLFGEEP